MTVEFLSFISDFFGIILNAKVFTFLKFVFQDFLFYKSMLQYYLDGWIFPGILCLILMYGFISFFQENILAHKI
jgi:hypothetical protein